jgi:hypothetical protein
MSESNVELARVGFAAWSAGARLGVVGVKRAVIAERPEGPLLAARSAWPTPRSPAAA